MVDSFRGRREVVVEGLNSIEGLRMVKPQGAFYVSPNIEGVGWALANSLTTSYEKRLRFDLAAHGRVIARRPA